MMKILWLVIVLNSDSLVFLYFLLGFFDIYHLLKGAHFPWSQHWAINKTLGLFLFFKFFLFFVCLFLFVLRQGFSVQHWISWKSLCRPDCPQFQKSIWFCLPSTGITGMDNHFLAKTLVSKNPPFDRWWQWRWRTPLIPALERQRQRDFGVWGHPGLQSEFQYSQGYPEKHCLKKNPKK